MSDGVQTCQARYQRPTLSIDASTLFHITYAFPAPCLLAIPLSLLPALPDSHSQTRPSQAPLPADQLKKKREDRETKQAKIAEAVDEWRDYTFAKADELAEQFDMKPHYFLRHLLPRRRENGPPPGEERAAENRELGVAMKVPELHAAIIDDYNNLTDEQKDALCDRHRETRIQNLTLRRETPRGKIQDVANVVRNLEMLFSGLAKRVGIQGMFCIVRDNTDFHMVPRWYFTSAELERYMPIATCKTWDTGEVGMKLEAFAIAGLDPANLLRNSKQKADWLKMQIRDKMKKMIVEATGQEDATMAYTWFEEDVVQRYNIVLEGWTAPRFVNPSELSTSLPALRTLLDAMEGGDCKFTPLNRAQAAERKAQWEADVAAGKKIATPRKVVAMHCCQQYLGATFQCCHHLLISK
ncbi:hypothetical protein C8R43DRAFT_1137262 [Mycena crocata]|nr:hypothetical protein C8R43DRAFT_1137262 [Mycena crocata]